MHISSIQNLSTEDNALARASDGWYFFAQIMRM